MHCHTGCICLTFKHCVYSNVSKGEDNLGGPATSSIFQICSGYLQEVHWGRCSQRQRFSQFDKFDILIERNTKQCRENSIFVGYGGWDKLAYSISRKIIYFKVGVMLTFSISLAAKLSQARVGLMTNYEFQKINYHFHFPTLGPILSTFTRGSALVCFRSP